ncbi:MAG: acetolactate synthase, partial [Proteiniphilum sp.]|nr:acetolactate synthase [Proteiniphilum sp.]
LYRILEILTAEKINVDYMYAFSNNDVALAVIRAADIVQMSGVLEKNNQQLLSQADIYQL